MENDDPDAEEDIYWPKDAFNRHNHFGSSWCSENHALLEYQFKSDARPNLVPGLA